MTKEPRIREEKMGYGLNGITINLSLAHIFYLCEVRDRIKANKDEHGTVISFEEQGNILNALEPVIKLIVKEIKSPMSSDLWKVEEEF
jgi:hypothetical protein